MHRPLRILIVAQSTSISNLLAAWLHPVPYELAVVSQFAAAKVHLDMEPDLLITELKLREHNGLHLALRAQSKSVPAIVIGDPDPVLERDASELGATYMHTSELRHDEFMTVVARLIASATHVPRTRLGWLDEAAASLEAALRSPVAAPSCFDAARVTSLVH